jgi:hypothetical protein
MKSDRSFLLPPVGQLYALDSVPRDLPGYDCLIENAQDDQAGHFPAGVRQVRHRLGEQILDCLTVIGGRR